MKGAYFFLFNREGGFVAANIIRIVAFNTREGRPRRLFRVHLVNW